MMQKADVPEETLLYFPQEEELLCLSGTYNTKREINE